MSDYDYDKVFKVVHDALNRAGEPIIVMYEILEDLDAGRMYATDFSDSTVVWTMTGRWFDIVAIDTTLDHLAEVIAPRLAEHCERFGHAGVRARGRKGWARLMEDYVSIGANGDVCMATEDLRQWAQKHRKAAKKAKGRATV